MVIDMATRQGATSSDFHAVKFRAHSALLRELGERLVGQPHIALAELIKNAYDADATRCEILISKDKIIVTDNGHGMTEKDFLDYWMTIGTRNKQDRDTSRELRRRVTGSKGVGRLSAQFLARKLEIVTSPKPNENQQLRAIVDWDAATEVGALTEAEAHYRTESRSLSYPMKRAHGTQIAMTDLKQTWDAHEIRDLGRQLWMLQPPISRYGAFATRATDPDDFRIILRSDYADIEDTFDQQMKAILSNHMATISGNISRDGNNRTRAHVKVTFRTGEQHSERFDVDPLIASARWHIRVFNLSGKQSGGIRVGAAREYFARFGGVMVYDGGFRLPYYGVEQDWLGIEYDHSHRKSRSTLLPSRLQVRRALSDLPTQGRLFGMVSIDTGHEARSADASQMKSGDYLKIQVARDRLVSNRSYRCLRDAVRWSLDYYATRQWLREQQRGDIGPHREIAVNKVERVRLLLDEARESHPQDDTIVALQEEISGLSSALGSERDADERARVLLGPLASAGMATLALEHESRREIRRVRQMLGTLTRIGTDVEEPRILEIGQQIGTWIDRLDDTRRLFRPLLDSEDRNEVESLSASAVLRQVIMNLRPMVANMTFSVLVPSDVYLPPATFAEWNSVFQNVIFNAANATLDLADRRVRCSGGRTGRAVWIRIEDNGSGVDHTDSVDLFEPFIRRITVSGARRALGLGGMGLGLTIVRMIAIQRHARVAFVKPSPGWATAFQLSWGS